MAKTIDIVKAGLIIPSVPREKLRDFRLRNGYNQAEMAEKLGYKIAQYHNIERGKVKPSAKFIIKFMTAFGMSKEQALEVIS